MLDGFTITGGSNSGYNRNFYTSGHAPEAVLMGMDGSVLHRWRYDFLDIWPDYPKGWLHTGDVVEIDEADHLKIVDRKKSIIITAGGKNIAPSEVENALKASPNIKEAIVLGEGEKFVAALIQIDFDVVGKWAIDNKVSFTNFKSLSQQPEVLKMITEDVQRGNDTLAQVKQVRKFKLLEKELDHDDNEVTATMKVRRSTVEKKFGPLIREIYGEVR